MASFAARACAALALALSGCGRDGGGPTDAPVAFEVQTGRLSWFPSGEGERLPYVEEVVVDAAAWQEVWGRSPVREPAPAVDFAQSRVVVVAQHALNAGYGGADLAGVRREGEAVVVEYAARTPPPGSVQAQVYKGYVGFYVVVPRAPERLSIRRRPVS
jgi:hypothetical protein